VRLFCFVLGVGIAALVVSLAAAYVVAWGVSDALFPTSCEGREPFLGCPDKLETRIIGVVILAVGILAGWLGFVLWRSLFRRIRSSASLW
jgi:hypothetical protein